MPYKDPIKQKEAQKKHYEQNKESYKSSSYNSRIKRKQVVVNIKESSPCIDCNKYYPYWVMQFDHVNSDKVADVAKLITYASMEKVLKEIAKCELVCANCHWTRTYKRNPSKRLISKYENMEA